MEVWWFVWCLFPRLECKPCGEWGHLFLQHCIPTVPSAQVPGILQAHMAPWLNQWMNTNSSHLFICGVQPWRSLLSERQKHLPTRFKAFLCAFNHLSWGCFTVYPHHRMVQRSTQEMNIEKQKIQELSYRDKYSLAKKKKRWGEVTA